MRIPTEDEIKQDAEIAARYFRTLIEQGITEQAATTLTGNYMITLRFEKPKEPWDT